MLVLSRKEGETLRIGDALVTIVSLSRGVVKIGVDAPPAVPVFRSEIDPDRDAITPNDLEEP